MCKSNSCRFAIDTIREKTEISKHEILRQSHWKEGLVARHRTIALNF